MGSDAEHVINITRIQATICAPMRTGEFICQVALGMIRLKMA